MSTLPNDLVLLEMPDPLTGEPVTNRRTVQSRPVAEAPEQVRKLVPMPMPDPLTGKVPDPGPAVNCRQFTPRPLAVNVADLVPLAMPGEQVEKPTPTRTPAQPATNWQRGFVANAQPTGWIGAND